MKTWKQLEAMAKRQGLSVTRGGTMLTFDEGPDSIMTVYSWMGRGPRADRVLRVICEAALREMARKR